MEKIAKEISNVFDNEVSTTYYANGAPKTENRPRILCSGKLYRRYHNIKYKKRQLSGKDPVANTESDIEEEDLSVNDVGINYLKNFSAPQDLIVKYFQETVNERKKLLKESSLDGYLQSIKFFACQNGYELFIIDYKLMYPESIDHVKKWNQLMGAINQRLKKDLVCDESDNGM